MTLVGHRFPDGVLRIEPYEDWLLRDAIGAPTGADEPHPAWAVVGAMRGMGADLTAVIAAVGAEVDDGVLLGGTGMEEVRPLRLAHDYVVRAEIVEVTRKHGASAGAFDLVVYEVEIADADGPAVRCRQSMVVPRAAA